MGLKSVIILLRQWCWGRQEVANDREEWAEPVGGQGGSEQLTKSLKELGVRCSAPLRCDLILFSGLEMFADLHIFISTMIIVFVKGEEGGASDASVNGECGFC